MLSFWTEKENRLAEDKATHTRALLSLEWSPDGSRLLTGDDSGKVTTLHFCCQHSRNIRSLKHGTTVNNLGSDRKTVGCVILLGCRCAIKLGCVILLGFSVRNQTRMRDPAGI